MPTRRLTLPALCLVLLGTLATFAMSTPSADASSAVLCRGFVGCTEAEMSNHGYAPVYRQMWWRMYGGHNCTNYVAYRMVSRGMSATRPWNGSGDARNWGVVFKEKVNRTPMVGSIAWWSSNHVAYVERIIDADTFIISEDHYGGDFDWRRISRSGGGWPTGFIHLNDERVSPVGKPAIVGTAQVDEPLVANRGKWNQNGATYSYQWYAEGAPISGATDRTFVPTADLVGTPVQVRVRGYKPGYLAGATLSAPTAATAPGTFENLTAPVISGIPKVGADLTATTATFAPEPATTVTAWFADGVKIAGATGPALRLGPGLLGRVITVRMAAVREGYTASGITSEPTAEIGPEKIVVNREPTLAGVPFASRSLAVRGGVLIPSGLQAAYAWTRDGVEIPDASEARYPLGRADVGHRIGVRVTWTKPGYTPVTRTLITQRTIRAYPRINLVSNAHRQLTVAVRATGVNAVRGQVIVRTLSGAFRTVTLSRGVATFSAPWIHAGERSFTLEYLGSYAVPARKVTREILVR